MPTIRTITTALGVDARIESYGTIDSFETFDFLYALRSIQFDVFYGEKFDTPEASAILTDDPDADLVGSEVVFYEGFAPLDVTIASGTKGLIIAGGHDAIVDVATRTDIALLSGDGDDTITVDSARFAAVWGGGGDDQISASGGVMFRIGGYGFVPENATVYLNGGEGDDTLIGGSDVDHLEGGEGQDRLSAGSGADTLMGGEGDDTLDGGSGADALQGGLGRDQLLGGRGADTLDGGSGDDTLTGGSGADVLDGGAGWNLLVGEQGDDTFLAGTDRDTVVGGSGHDTLIFAQSRDDIAFVSVTGANTLIGFQNSVFVTYSGIESVVFAGDGAEPELSGPDLTGQGLTGQDFTGQGFAGLLAALPATVA
jgi:Ca2+-binding RTX toxin-like protein